jgi:ABC-type Na+ efflux pump permease subunit
MPWLVCVGPPSGSFAVFAYTIYVLCLMFFFVLMLRGTIAVSVCNEWSRKPWIDMFELLQG